MKTTTTISFLAALSAALLAPISLELAGALFLAAGLTAIFATDYASRVRLPDYGMKPGATVVATAHAAAALRLAA